MRCFFSESLLPEKVFLEKDEETHLFSVLRAKEGARVILIDGRGSFAEAQIEKDKGLRIIKRQNVALPTVQVHLFFAVPQKNKLDILLTQCTEAGVWAFHPIITENSVALPKGDMIIKWGKKIKEACKQSHNPFMPKLNEVITFDKAIQQVLELKYTAFYGNTDLNERTFPKGVKKNFNQIAWFVGPEGGFSEKEIENTENAGFYSLNLGNWVMRVETAALAGTVLLQRLFAMSAQ